MRKPIMAAWILSIGLSCLGTVGCGEDQPNAPAKPEEATTDFGKSAMDQMKAANTGMDLKKGGAKR